MCAKCATSLPQGQVGSSLLSRPSMMSNIASDTAAPATTAVTSGARLPAEHMSLEIVLKTWGW
eukprot:10539104-Alexandrium_andersonii.AAC.1